MISREFSAAARRSAPFDEENAHHFAKEAKQASLVFERGPCISRASSIFPTTKMRNTQRYEYSAGWKTEFVCDSLRFVIDERYAAQKFAIVNTNSRVLHSASVFVSLHVSRRTLCTRVNPKYKYCRNRES